jgi:hypothetical protein
MKVTGGFTEEISISRYVKYQLTDITPILYNIGAGHLKIAQK